jgi:nucleotide-binding universal stress UspA family protein
MTTISFESLPHSTRQNRTWAAPRRPRYLVAVDGSRRSDDAIAAASALAAESGADVELVSVVDGSIPDRASGEMIEARTDRRARQLRQIRDQVRRVLRRDTGWPITLADGRRAEAIAEVASNHRTSLIVLGSNRISWLRRLFGRSTRIELLLTAAAPILTIPRGGTGRHHRAVVATDFGPESVRGAKLAIDLMADGGVLYLLHVMRKEAAGSPAMVLAYAALTELAEILGRTTSLTIEPICLCGDVRGEISSFAECSNSDLVVVGSHGRGRVAELLWATLPMRLLRRAATSVLVVPSIG